MSTAAEPQDIAIAMHTALKPLAVDKTLKLVDYWMAPLNGPQAIEAVFAHCLNRSPAALIGYEGEDVAANFEVLSGDGQTEVNLNFVVLLVDVTAGRSARDALVKDVPGPVGVLRYVRPIQAALNRLVIDGLVRNKRLTFNGTQWLAAEPGKRAVLKLRFSALVALPNADLPDEGTAMTGVHIDEVLHPASGETVPDSLDPFNEIETPIPT